MRTVAYRRVATMCAGDGNDDDDATAQQWSTSVYGWVCGTMIASAKERKKRNCKNRHSLTSTRRERERERREWEQQKQQNQFTAIISGQRTPKFRTFFFSRFDGVSVCAVCCVLCVCVVHGIALRSCASRPLEHAWWHRLVVFLSSETWDAIVVMMNWTCSKKWIHFDQVVHVQHRHRMGYIKIKLILFTNRSFEPSFESRRNYIRMLRIKENDARNRWALPQALNLTQDHLKTRTH